MDSHHYNQLFVIDYFLSSSSPPPHLSVAAIAAKSHQSRHVSVRTHRAAVLHVHLSISGEVNIFMIFSSY